MDGSRVQGIVLQPWVGFFYEDEGEEVQDDDDIGIGARVAARRRGRLHNGGGQME